MKKINIAVLGCGRIGQMHARNIALHEMTSLACVYDINEEFANKVAFDLGVSAVTNDQEVFSNEKIDAILVASPTDTHIEFIENSRDPGLPSWDYLKVSGGQFRDMTIHDFDLARFMLGEEPIRVFAISNALVEPKIKSELNDSDTLMVIMETSSGKQCNIINSRSAAYGYDQRVELFGSKGMVISDNRKAHEVKKFSSNFVEQKDPYLNFFIERYQEAYMNEITAFVEAIVNKTPPSVDFEDGRKALILAETAFKSIASGKMEAID